MVEVTTEVIEFVIDDEPVTDLESEKRKMTIFDKSFKQEKNEETNNKRGLQACWNCGEEGHNLQGCKMPRDGANIAKNRRAFMEAAKRKGSDKKLPKRYHEQYEQKYAKYRPGKISSKLRHALGLSRNQLPRYIYNMRKYGYPPGWLLEAEVLPSSINMYDGSGEKVPDPDDEEGEVESVHVKYNLNMIIDYPGFNCIPSEKIEEEADKYCAPSMRLEQSKENLIVNLKQKVLNSGRGGAQQGSSSLMYDPDESSDEDMDVEDVPETRVIVGEDKCKFVPPLPDEADALPPPPPDCLPEEVNSTPKGNKDESGSEEAFYTPEASPFSNLGKIRSVYYGTPILKSDSPYNRLPSMDNFRKGMGEVLNFENLPNSTGTYDKMVQVLKKIREKLTIRRKK